MDKINGAAYYPVRDWIHKQRKKGVSWETISSRYEDANFFEWGVSDFDFPETVQDDWFDIIEASKENEARQEKIHADAKKGLINNNESNNELTPSEERVSCWQLYKKKLLNVSMFPPDSVETIEAECTNILKRLSISTGESGPVKGLTVGNVQSGKTANMAGLIAMAADSGWNFFIVLSGTIEKLREQTRERLYNDLHDDSCKLVFRGLDRISVSNRDADINLLNLNSFVRYLTVCLKNTKRLTDLHIWLNSDSKKKEQLKILLIDDEADQASVNTADLDELEERKRINGLIVKIVEGRDRKGEIKKYGAMNYISYTATPYANFLSDDSESGLYPRNFICLLSPPNVYFGPKEIYGIEKKGVQGLSIIDTSRDLEREISPVHEGKTKVIPDGLRDAVCWFICCVCLMRKQGYKRPISMLVHTSHLTDDHAAVAQVIKDFLIGDPEYIIDLCRTVYAAKKAELPKSKFRSEYESYGVDDLDINDYLSFSEISNDIREFLNIRPSHIKISEDKEIRWGKGIHICIDNFKKEVLIDDEDAIPRLVYPSVYDSRPYPSPAPAFIVVGGNTLSRGLTIEGLVSTYFARKAAQADTLMQMGRWFGYRRGYELYPRIWMSRTSYDDFVMLAEVDEDLRDFIRQNYSVLTPEQFPPLVRIFPKVGYVREITSRAKRKPAVETGYDFTGSFTETCSFDKSVEILKHNIEHTKKFVSSLGAPSRSEVNAGCSIWKGVPGNEIFNSFFSDYKVNKRAKTFNEISELKEWIRDRSNSFSWNVILAGLNSNENGVFEVSKDIIVSKVERSAINDTKDGQIRLKSLSTAVDRFADVPVSSFDEEKMKRYTDLKKEPSNNWQEIREVAQVNNVPVLMIYCISRDSKPKDAGRFPLNAEEDIIGISVVMPGFKSARGTSPMYYQLKGINRKEGNDGDTNTSA